MDFGYMDRTLQMNIAQASAELDINLLRNQLQSIIDRRFVRTPMMLAYCKRPNSAQVRRARYNQVKKELARLNDPENVWRVNARKMLSWLDSGLTSRPPYSIFVKGNSKLPFFAFSAAPAVTCPGMGACGTWCYSFRCWRNAAPFFRQIQNTILVKLRHDVLSDAFLSLPKNVTVRLYVDGDFDSVSTIEHWFALLKQRTDLDVYGYSKSWLELLQITSFPSNYKLNVSSGSRHNNDIRALVEQLPIARGRFEAVEIPKHLVGQYGQPEYVSAVREAGKVLGYEKSFACPGKCGPCTKKGHACGSERFDGIPILIGIH
jgi:hypothetical protein